MKSCIILLLVSLCLPSIAQKNGTALIPMHAQSWIFDKNKVTFSKENESDIIQLDTNSGQIVLKDLRFSEGVIEYDVFPVKEEFSQSFYFRRSNEKEQEIVYFRTSKINNKMASDAIQYAPYIDGVNLWDLYDEYQAPAMIKPNMWNHVKLVISGNSLQVFLNNSGKPSLVVPYLEARSKSGTIAFEGASKISNLKVTAQKNASHTLESIDLTDHDPKYIRNWQISDPQNLPLGQEPFWKTLPDSTVFTSIISAERKGLVNLTRKFGKNAERRMVWLKVNIESRETITKTLQLGFSDDVWVYVNRSLVLADKNPYWEDISMRKYPNGRISVGNTKATFNLRKGRNELLIGVANDYYGWGLIAKFVNTDGISFD